MTTQSKLLEAVEPGAFINIFTPLIPKATPEKTGSDLYLTRHRDLNFITQLWKYVQKRWIHNVDCIMWYDGGPITGLVDGESGCSCQVASLLWK